MTDILDLIDQATTDPDPRCWHCHGQLGASVSDDFCSQDCQTAWHAARSQPLVGYREPDDLPQHYSHEPALSPVDEGARWVSDMSARLDAELLAHTNIPPALAAPERTSGAVTYADIVRMYARLTDQPQRPRSFRFTQQQWDDLRAAIPGAPPEVRDPTGSSLFATPIQLVDHIEDSTPYQQGWPGTYTLNTSAWSTRAGVVYDIPTRGRCLVTGTPSVTPEDFTGGVNRDGHQVALTLTGERFLVTDEFLAAGCTRVELPARFVGGPFHDDTTPAPDPAPDQVQRLVLLPVSRLGEPVEHQVVVYQRHHSDGRYWYYIVATPDHRDRTVPADNHHPALTIRYLRDNFPTDQSLVEITGDVWRGRGMLPNELLADDNAVRGWFGGQRSDALARAEAEAYAEAGWREADERGAAGPVDWLTTQAMFRASWGTRLTAGTVPVTGAGRAERRLRQLYEGNWTPPDRPVLIFALGYPYARNVARGCDLNPQQWRYVPHVRRLHGLQGGRYYMDSSFWERPDAAEMLAVLQTRRMTEMTIGELGALNRA